MTFKYFLYFIFLIFILKSYFNTYNKLFNEILKLLFITKYIKVILLYLNILRKTHLLFFLLLSIFTSFFISNTLVVSAKDNDVHLVLDTKNINNLPNNFRTTSDLERLKNLSNINMKGLDTLNISGSQQFSPNNL